jgi:hypothetical protein
VQNSGDKIYRKTITQMTERERERERETGDACIQLTSTLSGSFKGLSTALSASLLGSDWLLLRRLPLGPR